MADDHEPRNAPSHQGHAEDAEATAQVFDLLLGDNLQGRKDHIAENGYKYLELADIS